jgi:hypothetical protein
MNSLLGMMYPTMQGGTFRPGQIVPTSGIYQVVHDVLHRDTHEVTCIQGEVFPPCNHCGQHPRFRLVREAVHLSHHSHFRR